VIAVPAFIAFLADREPGGGSGRQPTAEMEWWVEAAHWLRTDATGLHRQML
jgi:hypothetical protein